MANKPGDNLSITFQRNGLPQMKSVSSLFFSLCLALHCLLAYKPRLLAFVLSPTCYFVRSHVKYFDDCLRTCLAAFCAIQLDAGSPAKICLESRDEHSVIIVSYHDLKRCLETSYQEVLSGVAPVPAAEGGAEQAGMAAGAVAAPAAYDPSMAYS